MIDAIGWAATALFALSYFVRHPVAMRRTQALAAGLWMLYGALIHALPVIVANVIVAGLALWSSFAAERKLGAPATAPVAEGDGAA